MLQGDEPLATIASYLTTPDLYLAFLDRMRYSMLSFKGFEFLTL